MSWKPIIVRVDESPESASAAALGWRIAQAAGVTCHFVHATRDIRGSLDLGQTQEAAEELQLRLLTAVRQRVERPLEDRLPTEALRYLVVRAGRAPAILQRAVADYDAGLVVLGGKHHSALSRWLGGSTAHLAARTLDVPILVTTGAATATRRVLAAVDLSHAARPTVEAAERFARLFGGWLRVVHACEPPPPIPEVPFPVRLDTFEQVTHDRLEREIWPLVTYPAADKAVRTGFAAETIAREASEWDADLVVVGSHGKGWVDRLLIGSVTEQLLSHLPTSLLIVPVQAPERRDAIPVTESRIVLASAL